MNYKRIEWIFLIAFLLLNGYLVSIFYANHKSASQIVTENNTQIETIMKRENITYHHRLSNKVFTGSYLSGDVTEWNEQSLKSSDGKYEIRDQVLVCSLKNPLELTQTNAQQELNQFVAKKVTDGKDYTYLKEASTGQKAIVYSQTYQGIPIYDASAEVVLTKEESNKQEKVISYHQEHLDHIQPMREETSLISEREAIYTLYMNSRLSSGDIINWIKLAYTKVLMRDNTIVYVPTWMVSIKNNTGVTEVERVNAISNRLMNINNTSEGMETSE